MSAHTVHRLVVTHVILLSWTLAESVIVVVVHILHIKATAAVACGESLLININFAI
jgi:hypothetical protein